MHTRELGRSMVPRKHKPGTELHCSKLTLTEYQSLRVKGSCVLFLRPFLPLERRLFLRQISVLTRRLSLMHLKVKEITHFPTAMNVVCMRRTSRLREYVENGFCGQII